MNNNYHMMPMGMPFNVMMDQQGGPSRELQHQHQHLQHQQQDAVNNSAIAMSMNLDLDEDDDSEDGDKRAGGIPGNFEQNRANAAEAIQNFVMPEGFVADFVPSWTKNRSIIFDCGVKATHSASSKTLWFCLCSAQCQVKSSKGVGIAIKG